ncbi:MAG: CAP domain-containing protein [Candidatus Microsaccharimonas sp.]
MKTKQTHKKHSPLNVRKQLRHALIPHKGNHYRPHLVRLHGITAVLVLALFVQLGYGFLTAGRLEVLGRVSNISVSDLLTDTNEERAKDELPALKINEELSQAAFLKARDMFANNYWAHTSPSGVTPWKWLGDAGYNYDVAGENLAKNYPTADATVAAWMNSETHRANIMNSAYQDIGFAVVDGMLDGRDTTLVVAYYGTPASAAVEGSSAERVVFAPPVSNSVGNPLTYFGTALQSLSPATLGVLAMLAIVALVAVAAHHYRSKLPKAWRQSWKQHHGMYTLGLVVGLAVLIVFATGGGQI